MGYGDDLIVSSIVKRAHTKHNKPVCVGDGARVIWEEVFDHNPRIAREPYKGCIWVPNVMGARPYIDYEKTTKDRVVYKNSFHVEPGEIWLTDKEKARHAQKGFVYIEPNTKGTYGGNKDWGFEKWQKVVQLLPEIRFVQGKGRKLVGVEQIPTESFRDACSLLFHADFFVGTDGGLHHAAAALGKKAVVVWGGLVSPKILGYETHLNLHSGVASCGNHNPCDHCKKALEWVTIEMVRDAIQECQRRVVAERRSAPDGIRGPGELALSGA